MKALSIQIVPAQPGFFVVLDFAEQKTVAVDDPVIAWRIETYKDGNGDGVFSLCTALIVEGDLASNTIGIQNPDMTVTVFDDRTYRSLAQLQADRYASEAQTDQ